MSNLIFCAKLKQQLPSLDTPPFPGSLGGKIFNQVSSQAWQMWIAHQTMLINEYRLNLSNSEDRDFLHQEMDKFFFGTGSSAPSGFNAP